MKRAFDLFRFKITVKIFYIRPNIPDIDENTLCR